MARPGEYYERGPSPWVPATILAIILLIATTPYRMAADPGIAYQTTRRTQGFPLALVWVPVIFFLLIQFFGGAYRPYRYDRLGRPVMRFASYGGGLAGGYGDSMYMGGPYNYRRDNGPYDKGLMSWFMDYGGHWLLILLGITLFSMVGSGSAPVSAAAIAPSRLGFPWSLFAPRHQFVGIPYI